MKNPSKVVWLTDKEVAEHLKVSRMTIRRWSDNFNLPFSQISDVRRYSLDEVNEWFASYSPRALAKGFQSKQ